MTPSDSSRKSSRFRRLGYWTNPFETLPFERLAGFLPPPPEARLLARSKWEVLQLVGPEGAGKTTLGRFILAECGRSRSQTRTDRVEPNQKRLSQPPSDIGFWFVDEAQRLGWLGRRSLRSWVRSGRGRRLILATQKDLSSVFRSRIHTHEVSPSLDTLRTLVAARLKHYRVDDETPPMGFEEGALALLDLRCEGNMRAMREVLYTIFEEKTERSPVTVEEVDRLCS